MALRRVISAGLIVLFPLLSYAALRARLPAAWFGAVDFVLVSLVLAAMGASSEGPRRSRNAWIIFAASMVFGAGCYVYRPSYLVYLPSIVVCSLLAAIFQRTLRPGREPLITRFARIERDGQLAEPLVAYTRRLTWIWTLFFYALVVELVWLAWSASMETYLLFANTLNYVFVAAFFLVEYIYRRIRYHQYPHASPVQFVRTLITSRVIGAGKHS